MTDGSDDRTLTRDMIDVHGTKAAAVARDNARAAALARAGCAGKVLDQGAWHHPAAAG